jgi:hypothetical protein
MPDRYDASFEIARTLQLAGASAQEIRVCLKFIYDFSKKEIDHALQKLTQEKEYLQNDKPN